jgi:hypothetical protein
VISIEFVLNSDEDQDDMKYFLELTKWTPYEMEIYINFTNPLMVSRGLRQDYIICTIKNKDLFQAEDSNSRLMSERIYIQSKVPNQLPNGVSEEDLLKDAKTATDGIKAMFVVQIFLQICLKGSMKFLLTMYYTIQMMCYL